MSFISEFQAGLDEMQGVFVANSPTPSFNYNGVEYPAVINYLELSSELEEGGLLEILGMVIIVSKTVMVVEPSAGETLYIGLKKVRIEKVTADEVSFELHCKTAER